jgi:glucose/arabinose dehydrogenase/cytochrome c2
LVVGAATLASACSRDRERTERVAAGRTLFVQRCALCHAVGTESAQGPGLGGVVGRKAGTLAGFGFTPALRHSGLTWTEASLDQFLETPSSVVPGTTMPLAVPDAKERRALVAYLGTLRAEPSPSSSSTYVSSAAFGDFHRDAPGQVHHITLADLPAPFASPSVRNAPSIADRPEGVLPRVPEGFVVSLFAKDLENPRLLRVAPNGDVFVAESAPGRIHVLRGATSSVFASGLTRPFGIAFYPPGAHPQYVYVGNTNSIVRFPYENGDLVARASAEVIVPKLTATEGGHWTRDVAFSADGARMFVSVGSGSNVAEGDSDETHRADVLVMDPDGKNLRTFATGIRNCVALVVRGADLWCSTNERDGLGDDLVPDYVTRVREGAFYGWPWYYLGDHEDPRHRGERPDLVGKITVPDVLVQPHSASLGATFYDGAMFPAEYHGDMFVAFHGSWNRAHRTSPKVVRLRFVHGAPTGEYEDFVTGFVLDEQRVWARPVGVAVASDGALLVSEDGNNTIWRVARVPTAKLPRAADP